MSLLRTYAKFSKLTYHSARAFAGRNVNPSTISGVGSSQRGADDASNIEDIYSKARESHISQDAFNAQSPYGSRYQEGGQRSYSDNYNTGRGDINYGQNQSQYQYNSPNYNSSQSKDPISSTIEMAGSVANAAGNFAKDCVDRVTGSGNYDANRRDNYYGYDNRRGYDNSYRQDSYRNDNYRREQSPLDLINNAAENISSGITSAAQGLANVAQSFIPGAQAQSSYDRDRYSSDRYQDRASYRGPDRSNPQYYTSNDPQFSSFSSTGPTSGFGANQPQDYSRSNRNFIDETADNVRNFADQAAYSAREFVDRGFSNSAANMANSTIKGFADSAYTMASRFNPMNQGLNRNDNTFRYDNYNRDRYDYNRRDDYDRRSQNPLGDAVQAAFQNASEMARGAFNVATAIGSSFIPGAQNQYNSGRNDQFENRGYNYPNQSYRDQYVHEFSQYGSLQRGPQHIISTNTQFNAFSTAAPVSGFGQATTASDFASSAQNIVDSTVDNLNSFANQAREGMRDFVDQNAPYSSRADLSTGRRNEPSPGDVAGAVINAAGSAVKGIAEGMFSIASSFIPGSQNVNQRSDDRYGFQGGSYNSRPS